MREPVDLQAEIERRGLALFALPEGSASLVCGEGANAGARRGSTRSTASTAPRRSISRTTQLECCLVWSEPGRAFGFTGDGTRLGTHGGPRTRAQVAVVAGGHPAVEPLARAVTRHADRGRRLGADDRRAPRRRRSRRRPDGRSGASRGRHAARDLLDRRAAQASRPGTTLPRTLAASSARRSATRSSHSGMATNASVSSGVHHAALELERRLAPRGEQRAIRRVGREQVPLRGDVTTDEERDTWPEQASARVGCRRRRARRRRAASSRSRVRSSQPRSCTRPATWSSTSSGRAALSRSAHWRQWSRIDRPPSSSASRAASSAPNSSSTLANPSTTKSVCSAGRGRGGAHERRGQDGVRYPARASRRSRPRSRGRSPASVSPSRAGSWCSARSGWPVTLRTLGVGPGSIVTIGLPNSIEFIEAMLATWWLGATPQPISHRLAPAERMAILDLADPAVAVGVPDDEAGTRPVLSAAQVRLAADGDGGDVASTRPGHLARLEDHDERREHRTPEAHRLQSARVRRRRRCLRPAAAASRRTAPSS